MTTTPAIAWVARRHEVGRLAAVPVIDDQGIGVSRVAALPSHGRAAPPARMRTRADHVIERDPVHVSPAGRGGERVSRVLPHSITLGVERGLRRRVRGACPFPSRVVQAAPPALTVWPGAALDSTPGRVPVVVDVPIMIETPSVHLAQARALVRFRAISYRARCGSCGPLERAERVPVATEAEAVRLTVTVRVVSGLASVDRAPAHDSSLRARFPAFYGNTYCARCNLHRPVGEAGEFVWLDDGSKVGT
jgi:hypothetical protein